MKPGPSTLLLHLDEASSENQWLHCNLPLFQLVGYHSLHYYVERNCVRLYVCMFYIKGRRIFVKTEIIHDRLDHLKMMKDVMDFSPQYLFLNYL